MDEKSGRAWNEEIVVEKVGEPEDEIGGGEVDDDKDVMLVVERAKVKAGEGEVVDDKNIGLVDVHTNC